MESSDEFSRKTKDVSLQELRDRLAEFARVRGWEQYHSPRNLLLALVSPEFSVSKRVTDYHGLFFMVLFATAYDSLFSNFMKICI